MATTYLTAGDTYTPSDYSVAGFPSSEGWTLRFRLIPQLASAAVIQFDAVATADDRYRVQVPAAVTANWAPGEYAWFSYVQMGAGARYEVDRGHITIEPDPAQMQPGTDLRSQARKAVDDLNAALATFRQSGGIIKAYTIANRSMTFQDENQIKDRLNYWLAKLGAEEIRDDMSRGRGNRRHLVVGFR